MFGGATLLLHDESFIKWKPTVLYWVFSVILLFSNLLFHKNLMRTLLHEKIALPLHAWNRLNLSWSLFFAVLGFINLYVAFNYSTDSLGEFQTVRLHRIDAGVHPGAGRVAGEICG